MDGNKSVTGGRRPRSGCPLVNGLSAALRASERAIRHHPPSPMATTVAAAAAAMAVWRTGCS